MTHTTGALCVRPSRGVVLAVLVLGLLAAPSAPLFAQAHAPQAFAVSDAGIAPAPKTPVVLLPSEQFGLDLSTVDRLVLPALDNAALLAEDLAHPRSDRVLQYGVARDVVVMPADGSWEFVAPGVVHWAMDIESPGAIGIRARLLLDLPKGAQLFAYSPDDPTRLKGPYQGDGPFDGAELWTPTTFGDTLRLEVIAPATSVLGAPRTPFILDRIQHIYLDPVPTLAGLGPDGGGCHNDPNCYANWTSTAASVAGVGFISGNSLFCTGQLLTTQNGDQTPYFLTANHCIGNNSTAQSTEIYWQYETGSCNGSVPSLGSVPQSAVTTLLATKAGIGTYDFTLLMIQGGLPGGLTWSGWNAGSVSNGTGVTGIHHPQGTWKKISFGNKIAIGDPDLVQVSWFDGPTEPGSSGSGLYVSSSQQLIGQLSTGSSACGGLIGNNWPDQYGAFNKTYNDISGLLAAGSDDGFENNDTCAGAAVVGDGSNPDLVVKSTDEDWYNLTVPAGNTLDVDVTFTHNYGDIDIKLFNSCGGAQLGVSETVTNNESLSYTNTSGSSQTLKLHVYLYSDTRNEYTLVVDGTTGGGGGGPPNDNCSNAIVVGEGTLSFNTTGATTDGPNEPGPCNFFNYTQVGADVWYRYVPGCSGNATFSLCSSSYDTKLAVYNGSACPGSSSADGCNDDACGPGQGLQSEVVHPVVAGNSYLVRIGGYQSATGAGTLSITCDGGGGGPACQPSVGNQGPGTATLTICGDPSSGGTVDVDLTGATPNDPAYFVYSLSNTGTAFAGGVLVPFPNYQLFAFTTNGAGAVGFAINGGGGPATFYCQFAIKVSANSWWLSNAVALTLQP